MPQNAEVQIRIALMALYQQEFDRLSIHLVTRDFTSRSSFEFLPRKAIARWSIHPSTGSARDLSVPVKYKSGELE
jgi:hypothetical protein